MRLYNFFAFILTALILSTSGHAAIVSSIYVDAGSTGSRLHLFQYNDDEFRNIPAIHDVLIETVEPGLASYADHPEQAGAYMKKLFDSAQAFAIKNNINPAQIKVNIMGTGGMRSIPVEKQNAIYTNLETYLKQQYSFSINHIATIPGKMEAVYGWLTVNYLMANFLKHTPTVGTLEMGGSSTQIAFETTDYSKPEDTVDISIGADSFHIFGKSFQNLGGDSVLQTLRQNKNAASCFPDGAVFMQSASGHFDETSCHAIYKNLIDDMDVAGQVIPVNDTKFIAYGRYYYTYKFFNVLEQPSQSALQANVAKTCHLGWDAIKQANANVPEKLLMTYCPYGIYFGEMIYAAYKINGDHLQLFEKIGEQKIEWTVGAVIYDLWKPE